jgi:NADPH-dependent 2,4-dienoyl-CoA reductase/sulfur reductase-like enzyme/rhodanese-related sulfurtransferase
VNDAKAETPLRLVIVGGVAGGASAAARARRLSEEAAITLLERDRYVSYANCGLPYHLGGVIADREDLLLHTPASLKARFNIDVRVRHEVTAIDRGARAVTVENRETGEAQTLPYDRLILATGARAVVPPVPGADGASVFTLKTVTDMDAILARLAGAAPRHATVVGGGYIGLEAAENLKARGLDVALVEMADQAMPPVDAELAAPLHEEMRRHGVALHLGARLTALAEAGGRTRVEAEGVAPFETDLVVMAVGVRPEGGLARAAGLAVDARGAVVVNDRMQTSDPDIYAVGDTAAVTDPVTGTPAWVPLAGPANRQGRIAADNIFGREARYRGTLGTAICKIFGLAVGMTGATEKRLQALGRPYRTITVHPFSHASYYPGAERLALKLCFAPDTGRLLGAQAVGADGVAKRVDVLATAIAGGMTVYDLEHLELSYAPPYGAAKDPVNMAGFVAANTLRGDHRAITADALAARDPASFTLVDVRQPGEHAAGAIPGSVLIPLGELRRRHGEIPRDRDVVVYCKVGQRGYYAQRILLQKGFRCLNLTGGYTSWLLAGTGPVA